MKSNSRIVIVSFPWRSDPPYKFISDILKILEPITCRIILLDGDTHRIKSLPKKIELRDIRIKMHYIDEIRPKWFSIIYYCIKCILYQLKISIELIKMKKDIDIVLFYASYPYHLLPLFVSKIINKKTIEILIRGKSKSFLTKFLSLQDPILMMLTDGISPESNVLIKELDLGRYEHKLLSEGYRFIDSRYNIKKKLNERKYKVGFASRIIKEKGIVEFIRSIPLVASKRNDVAFIIIGSGNMLDWVEEECEKFKSELKIDITIAGWIGEDIPEYLNDLKLLVLPTYSDSLPTIILEAMACGTIVLASPIGAIPGIVKDQETGFILKNNSKECITDNIIKILDHSDIDKIINNAKRLIEKNYSYDAAVNRYIDILYGKKL